MIRHDERPGRREAPLLGRKLGKYTKPLSACTTTTARRQLLDDCAHRAPPGGTCRATYTLREQRVPIPPAIAMRA
jgi:hypothetical protein